MSVCVECGRVLAGGDLLKGYCVDCGTEVYDGS